jgi:hypothetical protein
MTESEIQALSDEELSEEIDFLNRSLNQSVITDTGFCLLGDLVVESERRSSRAASQRAARGEQALPLDTV